MDTATPNDRDSSVVLVDIGIDLGTTVTKASAIDQHDRVLAHAQLATHWDSPEPGLSERDADAIVGDVETLLADLLNQLPDRVRVRSIGFASMAESGVLVNQDGVVVHPVIAWHDPRGVTQVETAPAELRDRFSATTGLPLDHLPTVFKLAWMRDQGIGLRGAQWLAVPEFVIHRLGGDRVSELSLFGRTGLLDQQTRRPWPTALDFLGVDAELVPPLVGAGTPAGRVRADHPLGALRGAVLTVGGHDHLVAAAALGSGAPGSCLDSLGTAEAIVASSRTISDPDAVAALAAQGLSVYPHVVHGATALLSGGRTGLVLRRILELAGASDDAGRHTLDEAAAARGEEAQAAAEHLVVDGFEMGDVDVVIRSRASGDDPVRLWLAALCASRVRLARVLDQIATVADPISHLVVVGGWTRLASVRSSRTGVVTNVDFPTLEEPGTWGAARFGRWAAVRAASDVQEPRDGDHRPPGDWFAAIES